jgi:hypothetical protein
MQSLCSAHLEEKHQWGAGIGVEDDLFLTNEEWTRFKDDAPFTGIPAHAVDLANKKAYAVGVFTLGGFEKIVEFNCGHTDYVCFSPSGYNGAFGGKTVKPGLTAEGNAWVWPQNVVPARIYIGKKGRASVLRGAFNSRVPRRWREVPAQATMPRASPRTTSSAATASRTASSTASARTWPRTRAACTATPGTRTPRAPTATRSTAPSTLSTGAGTARSSRSRRTARGTSRSTRPTASLSGTRRAATLAAQRRSTTPRIPTAARASFRRPRPVRRGVR